MVQVTDTMKSSFLLLPGTISRVTSSFRLKMIEKWFPRAFCRGTSCILRVYTVPARSANRWNESEVATPLQVQSPDTFNDKYADETIGALSKELSWMYVRRWLTDCAKRDGCLYNDGFRLVRANNKGKIKGLLAMVRTQFFYSGLRRAGRMEFRRNRKKSKYVVWIFGQGNRFIESWLTHLTL